MIDIENQIDLEHEKEIIDEIVLKLAQQKNYTKIKITHRILRPGHTLYIIEPQIEEKKMFRKCCCCFFKKKHKIDIDPAIHKKLKEQWVIKSHQVAEQKYILTKLEKDIARLGTLIKIEPSQQKAFLKAGKKVDQHFERGEELEIADLNKWINAIPNLDEDAQHHIKCILRAAWKRNEVFARIHTLQHDMNALHRQFDIMNNLTQSVSVHEAKSEPVDINEPRFKQSLLSKQEADYFRPNFEPVITSNVNVNRDVDDDEEKVREYPHKISMQAT